MIQGLWDGQAEAIMDVKLGDSDADFYKYDPMTALLTWRDTIKKYKHSKHCHYQQNVFLRFFFLSTTY